MDDYIGSIITSRDRFKRELAVLRGYDLGCVVVEASLDDVVEHRYRAGVAPSAVLGATTSIIVDRRVPVYFCSDRQLACRFVERLLGRYHRRFLADAAHER